MRLNVYALAFWTALSVCNTAHAGNSAQDAFSALTGLVGEWEGSYANGNQHRVSYRMTAGGTVLVETWTMSPTRESMTMYAVDGETLMATHYCPQGNQPRLALVGTDEDGRLQFRFRDAGNVQDPTGSHQHTMWLRLEGAARFTRSETYVGNADTEASPDAEGEVVVYRRVGADAS